MPELDSLRGMACLMVLFFHGIANRYQPHDMNSVERAFVKLCSYGWTGVNLFFVLSGFLITGILIEAQHRKDFYRRFYLRRALRILPLYYAILVLVAVLWQTGLTDRPMSWGFLGLSSVYLANLTPLVGVSIAFPVLWSLAVEEHFYLFWPTLIRPLSQRGVIVFALAVVSISLLVRLVVFWHGGNVFAPYTWMVCDGLAMGSLLAAAVRYFGERRSTLWRMVFIISSFSAFSFIFEKLFGANLTGAALQISGINAFFSALLLCTLLIGSRFGINSRILAFVGEISYGVYLLHILVFDFFDSFARRHFSAMAPEHLEFAPAVVRLFVVTVLTIFIAWISRRFYEEPFLRLKDKWDYAAAKVAAPENPLSDVSAA